LRRRVADDAVVAAAELVFGELIGNVVRHAPGPIEIELGGRSRPVSGREICIGTGRVAALRRRQRSHRRVAVREGRISDSSLEPRILELDAGAV
jgi:hypothetical protein